MPKVGLLIFDQPYNSLIWSYKKFLISRDPVTNWGQTYSSGNLFFMPTGRFALLVCPSHKQGQICPYFFLSWLHCPGR